MFPTLQIGPLALPAGPIILILSFVLALEAIHRAAPRLGLSGDDTYTLCYLTAASGVVGARLGYAIEHWDVYQHDLGAILSLTTTALSWQTGLSIALVAGVWYAQSRHLDNRRLLDALVPGLAILAGGLALADLANGSGYGAPTSLPWAISLWGAARHPVQMYHLLAVLVIAVLVLRAARPFDGAHAGLFVALYAASRLFLEAFHGASATVAGVRTVQVVSLVAVLLALWLLRRWALEHASGPMPSSPPPAQ